MSDPIVNPKKEPVDNSIRILPARNGFVVRTVAGAFVFTQLVDVFTFIESFLGGKVKI